MNQQTLSNMEYSYRKKKREAEIAALKKQIEDLENIEDTLKQRQATLRRDIRLMDSILAGGSISEANLRLLVEKIYISERDGKLDVDIHLKAWLYYRLSKDDDPEQNSLQNQRNICRNFAVKQGFTIAGESSDDNISGMTFSRLGRHKTQTALFIDFLRQQDIRVLSATEELDTLEENDDLIIGVRGLMNDYYARDIGQKIRAGYRQKQKEGLVIIPPFGYEKQQ